MSTQAAPRPSAPGSRLFPLALGVPLWRREGGQESCHLLRVSLWWHLLALLQWDSALFSKVASGPPPRPRGVATSARRLPLAASLNPSSSCVVSTSQLLTFLQSPLGLTSIYHRPSSIHDPPVSGVAPAPRAVIAPQCCWGSPCPASGVQCSFLQLEGAAAPRAGVRANTFGCKGTPRQRGREAGPALPWWVGPRPLVPGLLGLAEVQMVPGAPVGQALVRSPGGGC